MNCTGKTRNLHDSRLSIEVLILAKLTVIALKRTLHNGRDVFAGLGLKGDYRRVAQAFTLCLQTQLARESQTEVCDLLAIENAPD